MPDTKTPVLLSNASAREVAAEAGRRVQDWLAALPDGKRWTAVDWVFAAIVALLALGSSGFLTTTYRILAEDPDYFFRRFVQSVETRGLDPIETGAVTAAPSVPAGAGDAMPAPAIVRTQAPRPADYQIVMIFEGEVLLATARELMRARVGSVLPGLGAMLSLDPSEKAVRFENATLTAVP